MDEEDRNKMNEFICERLAKYPEKTLYIDNETFFSDVDAGLLEPGKHIKFVCKYGTLEKIGYSKFMWPDLVSEDEEQLLCMTFDEYAKALESIKSNNYKEKVKRYETQ